MATRPTRQQQQACEQIAEALVMVTEAGRLDGRSRLDRSALEEIARLAARASSAFGLEEIVARALEKRGRGLGMPASLAEMLSLMDSEIQPLEMLLLTDDEFRALVERMQEELGE